MSDTAALALLVVLAALSVAVIVWAWKTRAKDGPYVNEFVHPKAPNTVPAAWVAEVERS